MEEQGYRFTMVATAAEARTAAARERYDIAVVDVVLPGETGLSLADELGALGLGIILISGHPEGMARIKESWHAFLVKPFRLAELTAMIDRVLEAIDAKCAPGEAPDAMAI